MKIGLLAIVALGCRDARRPPGEPISAPVTEQAAATSSKARVWMDVEPAHLNPLIAPDEWCFRIALGPIYEPLFAVDAAGRAVPGGLAAAVQESADRLAIEVTLRDGARWHDGRPVASSDVSFTYEAILDPANGLDPLRRELADLHMVELSASRPRVVRVRNHRPNAFLAGVLSEIPVLPRHVFFSERKKIDWLRHAASRRPVGSGPYRLHEWKRGSRIVLRRVEDAGPVRAGALQEIVFYAEPDGAVALGQLRRDEIDVLSRVLPIHYPGEALTPLVLKRFREIRVRPGRFALLLLNVRRGPLQDARVRRALASAIDRGALLTDVRKGLGRLVAVPGLDGAVPLPHDVAAAGRLLDEVGLRRATADGPRLAGGRPWRMELLAAARAPVAEEQTRRIATDLAKTGISATPRFIEQVDLFGRLRKGAFDAAMLTFATRQGGDLSPLIGSGGAVNYGGFSDPGIDAALEAVRRLAPGPPREAAWLHMGRLVEEKQPVVFLYALEEAVLVRRTLLDVAPSGDWLDLLRATVADNAAAPRAQGGPGPGHAREPGEAAR